MPPASRATSASRKIIVKDEECKRGPDKSNLPQEQSRRRTHQISVSTEVIAFESGAQRRGTHVGDAKPEYKLSGVVACSFEWQKQRADLSGFFGTQIRSP